MGTGIQELSTGGLATAATASRMRANLITVPFAGKPALFRQRDPATGKMAVHRLAKKAGGDEKVA